MTKDELLSFIEFNNEKEKEEAEFYISVKGVALHCRVLDFLGFSFSLGEKVQWHKVSKLLRTDKATRDVIYIYLATLEEYIRAFIPINTETIYSKIFGLTVGEKETGLKIILREDKNYLKFLKILNLVV